MDILQYARLDLFHPTIWNNFDIQEYVQHRLQSGSNSAAVLDSVNATEARALIIGLVFKQPILS